MRLTCVHTCFVNLSQYLGFSERHRLFKAKTYAVILHYISYVNIVINDLNAHNVAVLMRRYFWPNELFTHIYSSIDL